jgi:galactokinase
MTEQPHVLSYSTLPINIKNRSRAIFEVARVDLHVDSLKEATHTDLKQYQRSNIKATNRVHNHRFRHAEDENQRVRRVHDETRFC